VDREGEETEIPNTYSCVDPQVECNRTVKEIAVDKEGEETEIPNTYNCLILRLNTTGQSRR
jgi:hypothetical protein